MMALVIPVEGPLFEAELVGESHLGTLQALVGGSIEAVPLPDFIVGGAKATAYVNEEGKYTPGCRPNMRATDFLVPGVGLFMGDFISGPLVLCGFDPDTGEHAELPGAVVARAQLIAREAG